MLLHAAGRNNNLTNTNTSGLDSPDHGEFYGRRGQLSLPRTTAWHALYRLWTGQLCCTAREGPRNTVQKEHRDGDLAVDDRGADCLLRALAWRRR